MFLGNANLRKSGEEIQYSTEMLDEIFRCSKDIIYFAEKYYTIVTIDKGKHKITLWEWQKKVLKSFVETPDEKQNIILKIARQSGKKFFLGTKMLTPSGLVLLENLKIGDVIYGRDGNKTIIKNLTEITNNDRTYEIEFDNGQKIKCCEDHLWKVVLGDRCRNKNIGEVLKTKEIVNYFNIYQKRTRPSSIFIEMPEYIKFDYKKVDIDPYLLGLWLGDGSKYSSEITCHKDDFIEYKQKLLERNIEIYEPRICKHSPNSVRFNVKGLKKLLEKNNLIKNKHIPDDYIFNSFDVRLNFLKGLMDTDGSIDKRGSCEFYQSDLAFIEKFRILLSTMSIKNRIRSKKTYRKIAYTVAFSTNLEVCNLSRKILRLQNCYNHKKNKRFYINKINEVPSVPMRCIEVDSEDHLFLCTESLIPTHNSTISSIYLLWFILFNRDKTVALMANKESLAIELLEKIKMSFRELPIWLQQGIVEDGWNKKKLALGNGSRIIAAATSSNALTGFVINLLYLDEFAKVPQHVADDFIASVYPVITSGKSSKIIMLSTPIGMNHFYNFWINSTRKDGNANSFYPISVNWREIPGRDDKFKKKIIKDIGLVRWEQEFQCKFLGSNTSLIDSDVLERIIYSVPKLTKWTGLLSVFEEPISNCNYVLGVDTGKGTGRDYSVVQIIKIINERQLEQVAIYRNNQIIPHDFAQVCVSIGKYYNNAKMLVENNDIGSSVADSIWYEYEYENLVNLDPRALGVRSTKTTKKVANMLLKEYVEKGWLSICDERTVYELSRYEEIKLGVFAAGRHEHDDTVTAILWALYYIKSDEFDGKSFDTKSIDNEYNVEFGKWNDDDELKPNEKQEQGDPNWTPSAIMDEDFM